MSGRRRRANKTDLEKWNAANPVGTPVRYWPGAREVEGRLGRLRSPATRLWRRGDPVVWVEGYAGCVLLSHVEVLPNRATGGLFEAGRLMGELLEQRILDRILGPEPTA